MEMIIALDLEGTLVSNAVSLFPRPSLFSFLNQCRNAYSRWVIFSTVSEPRFRKAASLFVTEGPVPSWFFEIEYIH